MEHLFKFTLIFQDERTTAIIVEVIRKTDHIFRSAVALTVPPFRLLPLCSESFRKLFIANRIFVYFLAVKQ